MPVCRYHQSGSCRYGSACRNSHLQAPCTYFAAGNCRNGDQCVFKHNKRRGDKLPYKNPIQKSETVSLPRSCDNSAILLPQSTRSGFRFLRVPSTNDNLSNKFRFSVPSPTPTTDKIFYSSDSDCEWCDTELGVDNRVDSCTLALYTCSKCEEQVLARNGEERITCPACEITQIEKVTAEMKESVQEESQAEIEMQTKDILKQQESKKNLKKRKKKRKKEVSVPFPSHLIQPDAYETPEGVKVYRAKENQANHEEIIQVTSEQIEKDSVTDMNDNIDIVLSVDSDLEPEPVFKMKNVEVLNVYESNFDLEENDFIDGDNEEIFKADEPKSNQSTSQKNYSDSNQESDCVEPLASPNNQEGVPRTFSKQASKGKTSRNKSQRKRTKRQYQRQECPPPSFQFDPRDSTNPPPDNTLMVTNMFNMFISLAIFAMEKILQLFLLSLAVLLFVLRLSVVMMVNLIYILYQLMVLLMRPFGYYVLHPTLFNIPGQGIIYCYQLLKKCKFVSNKVNGKKVALIDLARCKGRGVREQFKTIEARINFLIGVKSELDEEAEGHFTQGLEVEPNCARLLSARAKARYSQQKLCLALEDLAMLERSNVDDLVVGAKCYMGLGMFIIAKQILVNVKDSDDVNPFQVSEIRKQLIMEENLVNLPDQSQIELLRKLVEKQTASSLRYKVRLAELSGDIGMMKELVIKLKGGKGEHEFFSMYMAGLVEYNTGHLAMAAKLLLACPPPCNVARCQYIAQLAITARDRLELAQHCLEWGRVDQGEKHFKHAGELDLSNCGVAILSKLGLARCDLARGNTSNCLAVCSQLLSNQLEMIVLVSVMEVKAGALLQLGRYQDVINLVLSVHSFSESKELVRLLDLAKKELNQLLVKTEDGSHYHLLGLDKTAGLEEIKTAFKKLARENHPDKFVDPLVKVKQEEIMKEINQAYTTLSDEMTRAEYDMMTEKGAGIDSMDKEEMIKIFEEFFLEVQQAANEWVQKQAIKGKRVNKITLDMYINEYLLDNREYYTTKYKLHDEVFQAFRDSFKSSGSGNWGKKRNSRRW